MKLAPLGRLSVTTTLVAASGPALATAIEYVMGALAETGSGESDLVSERSEVPLGAGAPIEVPRGMLKRPRNAKIATERTLVTRRL